MTTGETTADARPNKGEMTPTRREQASSRSYFVTGASAGLGLSIVRLLAGTVYASTVHRLPGLAGRLLPDAVTGLVRRGVFERLGIAVPVTDDHRSVSDLVRPE